MMAHVDLMKRWGIFLCLVLCSSLPGFCAATETADALLRSNQRHSYLRQGIEKTFNLNTQAAFDLLQKVVDLDRENPTGYAFLSLVHLFASEVSFQKGTRDKHIEMMLHNVNEAVARGKIRIEKDPNDTQAYFAMALAKLSSVRWAIAQKQYLAIVRETSSILENIEKVRRGDPNNFDIYFLLGILHYHLDQLPGVTRFFSSLLITTGDRKKGLQELELTAQKGDLLKELALAELASIYANYEKQPGRALPIARKLREAFPANYNFLFVLSAILSDLYRFEEALVIAGEIDRGIQSGKPPYVPQLQARYELLMGRILFNQKEYSKAETYLQRACRDTLPYSARVRALAFVRLGMICDIRKERNQARDYYSRAMEIEGAEGSAQMEARKYMAAPFVPPPDQQK